MCVLLRALWHGDFEEQSATPTSIDRLTILRIIFNRSRNFEAPVIFLVQKQLEPPLVFDAPDGGSFGDLRLRLPVPSSDPAHWTIVKCDPAFKELEAECTPPATTLPWYMSDAVIAPIILSLEVSFGAFQRLIHANDWPVPQFWESPPPRATAAAPDARPASTLSAPKSTGRERRRASKREMYDRWRALVCEYRYREDGVLRSRMQIATKIAADDRAKDPVTKKAPEASTVVRQLSRDDPGWSKAGRKKMGRKILPRNLHRSSPLM
jgi:hypothetical protein